MAHEERGLAAAKMKRSSERFASEVGYRGKIENALAEERTTREIAREKLRFSLKETEDARVKAGKLEKRLAEAEENVERCELELDESRSAERSIRAEAVELRTQCGTTLQVRLKRSSWLDHSHGKT